MKDSLPLLQVWQDISLKILYPVVRLYVPIFTLGNRNQVLKIKCQKSLKQSVGPKFLFPLQGGSSSTRSSPPQIFCQRGPQWGDSLNLTSCFFSCHFFSPLWSVPIENLFSSKKQRCKLWKINASYLQILNIITFKEIRHYNATPAWL